MDLRASVAAWTAMPNQAWGGLLLGAIFVCLEFVRPTYGVVGLAGGVAFVVCAVRLGPVACLWLGVVLAALLLSRRSVWWLPAAGAGVLMAAQAAGVSWAAATPGVVVALAIAVLLRIAERARSAGTDR